MTTRSWPREPVDPGPQAERTYLAWQRTGVAFGSVGALLLHSGLSDGSVLSVPGAGGVVSGALLIAAALPCHRTAVHNAHRTSHRRLVACVTTVLCLTGLGALLM